MYLFSFRLRLEKSHISDYHNSKVNSKQITFISLETTRWSLTWRWSRCHSTDASICSSRCRCSGPWSSSWETSPWEWSHSLWSQHESWLKQRNLFKAYKYNTLKILIWFGWDSVTWPALTAPCSRLWAQLRFGRLPWVIMKTSGIGLEHPLSGVPW